MTMKLTAALAVFAALSLSSGAFAALSDKCCSCCNGVKPGACKPIASQPDVCGCMDTWTDTASPAASMNNSYVGCAQRKDNANTYPSPSGKFPTTCKVRDASLCRKLGAGWATSSDGMPFCKADPCQCVAPGCGAVMNGTTAVVNPAFLNATTTSTGSGNATITTTTARGTVCPVMDAANCPSSFKIDSVNQTETRSFASCTIQPDTQKSCGCRSSWLFKGDTFNGCYLAPSESVPWCYVNEGYKCASAKGSTATVGEERRWRYCTLGGATAAPTAAPANANATTNATTAAPTAAPTAATANATTSPNATKAPTAAPAPDSAPIVRVKQCQCKISWTAVVDGANKTMTGCSLEGTNNATGDGDGKFSCDTGAACIKPQTATNQTTKSNRQQCTREPCQCVGSVVSNVTKGVNGGIVENNPSPYCYVAGFNCPTAVPSMNAGYPYYRNVSADPCACRSSWLFNGSTYKGCAAAPSAPVPWCYVEDGYACAKGRASDSSTEERKWSYCSTSTPPKCFPVFPNSTAGQCTCQAPATATVSATDYVLTVTGVVFTGAIHQSFTSSVQIIFKSTIAAALSPPLAISYTAVVIDSGSRRAFSIDYHVNTGTPNSTIANQAKDALVAFMGDAGPTGFATTFANNIEAAGETFKFATVSAGVVVASVGTPAVAPTDDGAATDDGMATWAIVLIVIAVVLVLGAVAFFVFKNDAHQSTDKKVVVMKDDISGDEIIADAKSSVQMVPRI